MISNRFGRGPAGGSGSEQAASVAARSGARSAAADARVGRRALRTALLLPWVLLVAACSGRGAAGPLDGVNIVVVVIDTLRADRLGVYGHDRETAPFLAGLAAEGVVFENARSASSWTAPATASLFTGLYPDQHGVVTGYKISKRLSDADDGFRLNRIPTDLTTLPERLRAAGYRTFGVADNPNICESMGFARGFDRFASFDYASAEAVNDQLAEWLGELRSGGPWFCYLHYMDPHSPYHAREPWYAAPEGADVDPDAPGPSLARYDSEIGYVDHHLREALSWLDPDGTALVVVTSDHGEEFGEHGRMGHPFQVHEELLRVPFLVRGPVGGPIEPARVPAAVTTLDLVPTLDGLLGLERGDGDAAPEGVDLTALLLGQAPGPPEDRLLHALRTEELKRRPETLHALVRGDLKAILGAPRGTVELYDLAVDPGETEDLATRRPRSVEEFRAAAAAFAARSRAAEREFTEPLALDAEQRAVLERLGYVDDR